MPLAREVNRHMPLRLVSPYFVNLNFEGKYFKTSAIF